MIAIGVVAVLAAAAVLALIVGHDVRAGDDPVGAGSSLMILVSAVAVVALFSTGIALIGMTWVLSMAGPQ